MIHTISVTVTRTATVTVNVTVISIMIFPFTFAVTTDIIGGLGTYLPLTVLGGGKKKRSKK